MSSPEILSPFEALEGAGYDVNVLAKGCDAREVMRGLLDVTTKAELVNGKAQSTYLRTLVGTSIGYQGRSTRGESDVQAITVAHDSLYAEVLKFCDAMPDVVADPSDTKIEASDKRLLANKRSNFARSARSTLGKYLAAGGKLAAIPVAMVTKDWLRKETVRLAASGAAPTAPTVPGHVARNAVERAFRRLVKAIHGHSNGDLTVAADDASRAVRGLTSIFGVPS